jgi:inosine-uridine nucleoside N-ribohydrolase
MKNIFTLILILINIQLFISCGQKGSINQQTKEHHKYQVIFDTDANNELDDQHALAYLLFNGNTFDVKGVTVNTTFNGGNIDKHYEEAERVITLCGLSGKIPLFRGANSAFEDIRQTLDSTNFDGYPAVNFIIEQTKQLKGEKLIVIAVGKLTNVALALEKEPSMADKIRLVWLGANYPDPGEYNLVNDIPAMNYLLESEIDFEMVTVRYGKPSGTDAVRMLEGEAQRTMPGLGPEIDEPVTGRHGDTFNNFGDYSVSLFEHCEFHGDPPGRSLFDMAAVAIVKNPDWAEASKIPCPIMVDEEWVEQPENQRMITVWENFDKVEIMNDFYASLKNYVLVK